MTVTLVVPLFNESKRFSPEYFQQLRENNLGLEFVFVDDGSTDNTYDLVLGSIAEADRIVRLPQNRGKAEAVRQGMQFAFSQIESVSEVREEQRLIGFVDSDGAFGVNSVTKFLDDARRLVDSPDARSPQLFIASRVKLAGWSIQRSSYRHWISRIILSLCSLGRPHYPYDTQSGLKVFSFSTSTVGVWSSPFRLKWLFDVEFLERFFAVAGKESVLELPVHEWREIPGGALRLRSAFGVLAEFARLLRLQRQE